MRRWRQILLTGLLLAGVSYFAGMQAKAAVPVNEEHFPDSSVRKYAESVDKDKDGVLSDEELQSVTSLTWGLVEPNKSFGSKPGDIVDFTGMENFTAIKYLHLRCVGSTGDRWNYSDSNLFRYFPNIQYLSFDPESFCDDYSKAGVGEISLIGTSDCLQYLRIGETYSWVETVVKRWDVKAKNLETFQVYKGNFSGCKFSMEGFPSLKNLEIDSTDLHTEGIPLKGLFSLEYLDLSRQSYGELDLSPAKKSLKTLLLGPCVEVEDRDNYDEGSQELKTLDISQMEKLERVMAGHTGITKLITKDNSGKSKTKKLKELCVSACKIKSIDVTGMPNLETLCVYDTLISKLDVTKNKKLNSLQAGGQNLKSINVKKNTKLDTLNLRGNIKNLDLSKNTSLRTFYLAPGSKKARMTKLTLPMLKKSMKWAWKRFAPGYAVIPYNVYFHKVSTLDLSKITKLTAKTKKYEMLICEEMKLKTVIVSKKLKKADRKWIQKRAKQAGAKVVVK